MSLRQTLEQQLARTPAENTHPPGLFPDAVVTLKRGTSNPCGQCPLRRQTPTLPAVRPDAKLIVVGYGPQEDSKATTLLTSTLAASGLDLDTDVLFLGLTRCVPTRRDWSSPEWSRARGRCQMYLDADLRALPSVPLLLLGKYPTQQFVSGKRVRTATHRGMWWMTAAGRPVFVSWHPGTVVKAQKGMAQFVSDLSRCVKRVTGEEQLPPVAVTVLSDVRAMRQYLRWLAQRTQPLAFDIETYDALAPHAGRDHVATNPYHPDFRVRGIGIAHVPHKGVFLDLLTTPAARIAADLTAALSGPAKRYAFHGNFDAEALMCTGLTTKNTFRHGDGLLGLIALGDGTWPQNTLARAMVELLNEVPHWDIDKRAMGTLPVSIVAEGCVRDAAATLRLCNLLHKRLRNREYL